MSVTIPDHKLSGDEHTGLSPILRGASKCFSLRLHRIVVVPAAAAVAATTQCEDK